MDEPKNAVQSLSRTFDIIEALTFHPRGLTLTEISRHLSLHKSTAFRILGALQERGYIEKTGTIYKLGLQFIHIASQYLNSLELKTEAEPFLRELSRKTGQTVFLATRDQDEIIYIDKIEEHESFRRYSIIGTRQPLYCTSLGRAFLMGETDAEVKAALAQMNLAPRTPATVTDGEVLADMISRFRLRGWSEDQEEHTEGVNCVGAPVFDYRNSVVAAVSTVWEAGSPDAVREENGELVKKTARRISERLGWIGRD
jgi:DNA-binding IclR family transcriptional regulator